MIKKNFGKILFFLLNVFLVIAGSLYIKNKEEKKTDENAQSNDSAEIKNEKPEEPSSAENISDESNDLSGDIISNTAPASPSITAPVSLPASKTAPVSNPSSTNASKAKPKTKTS